MKKLTTKLFTVGAVIGLLCLSTLSVEAKMLVTNIHKEGIVLTNRLDLGNSLSTAPGYWRRNVADDAWVVKEGDNQYRMLFSGLGCVQHNNGIVSNIWSLGEATASDLHGLWTISNGDQPKLKSENWDNQWGSGHLIASMFGPDGNIIYECAPSSTMIGKTTGSGGSGEYNGIGSKLFSGSGVVIADPCLVKNGDTYHLFYSRKADNEDNWKVYERTANTYDNLADVAGRPVVSPGGSCAVVEYEGIWYMAYSYWAGAKNKIALMKSDDLKEWTQFGTKPLFEPDDGYDQHGAQDPGLYVENDTMYVYYGGMKTASNNGNDDTSICLVTVSLDEKYEPVITEGESTTMTVPRDTSTSLTLHASHELGDSMTWSFTTVSPLHGTVSGASGTGTSKTITYMPHSHYTGLDFFEVRVTDNDGDTDTIVVYVYVKDGPERTIDFESYSNDGQIKAEWYHSGGHVPASATLTTSEVHGGNKAIRIPYDTQWYADMGGSSIAYDLSEDWIQNLASNVPSGFSFWYKGHLGDEDDSPWGDNLEFSLLTYDKKRIGLVEMKGEANTYDGSTPVWTNGVKTTYPTRATNWTQLNVPFNSTFFIKGDYGDITAASNALKKARSIQLTIKCGTCGDGKMYFDDFSWKTDPIPVIAQGKVIYVDVNQGVSKKITLNAMAGDGDPITWGIAVPPVHGSLGNINGMESTQVITYTPDDKFVGSDSFRVFVENNKGEINTSTINLTVGERTTGWEDVSLSDYPVRVESFEWDGEQNEYVSTNETTIYGNADVLNNGALEITSQSNLFSDYNLLVVSVDMSTNEGYLGQYTCDMAVTGTERQSKGWQVSAEYGCVMENAPSTELKWQRGACLATNYVSPVLDGSVTNMQFMLFGKGDRNDSNFTWTISNLKANWGNFAPEISGGSTNITTPKNTSKPITLSATDQTDDPIFWCVKNSPRSGKVDISDQGNSADNKICEALKFPIPAASRRGITGIFPSGRTFAQITDAASSGVLNPRLRNKTITYTPGMDFNGSDSFVVGVYDKQSEDMGLFTVNVIVEGDTDLSDQDLVDFNDLENASLIKIESFGWENGKLVSKGTTNMGEYQVIDNRTLKITSIGKNLFSGKGTLEVTLQFPGETYGSAIQYDCDMSVTGTEDDDKGWEENADFQVRFIDEDKYAWEELNWIPGTSVPDEYVSAKMNHSLETNCIQFQIFGKGKKDDDGFSWTISNLRTHFINLPPEFDAGVSTNLTVDENVATNINLTASDQEGDAINWYVSPDPEPRGGTVEMENENTSGTNKNINYTPNDGFNGSDSFVIGVYDNAGTNKFTVNMIVGTTDSNKFETVNLNTLENAGLIKIESFDWEGEELVSTGTTNMGKYEVIDTNTLKITSVDKNLFGGFGRLDVTLQFPGETNGSIVQYDCDMSVGGRTNYGKGWEKSAEFQVRFIDEDKYAWEELKWSPGTALPETYVSTKMNHSLETNCIQFQLFGKGDGNDNTFDWTISNLRIDSTNLPPGFDAGVSTNIAVVENGGATTINLTASDQKNDAINWYVSTNPGPRGGTVVIENENTPGNNKNINYTPNDGFNGSDSFVIGVYDNAGTNKFTVNMIVGTIDSNKFETVDFNALTNAGLIKIKSFDWNDSGELVSTGTTNMGKYEVIDTNTLKITSKGKDLFGGCNRLDVTLQFPGETEGSIVQYDCDMSIGGTTNYGKGWEKSAEFQVRFIDEDDYAWEKLKWSPGTAVPETYVSTKMNHSLKTNCIQFQLFGKGDGNDDTFDWTISNLQIHSTNLPPRFDAGVSTNIAVAENGATTTINLTASDQMGDDINWYVSSDPSPRGGTVVIENENTPGNNKNITYEPNDGFNNGSDSFVIGVYDNAGTNKFTVNVIVGTIDANKFETVDFDVLKNKGLIKIESFNWDNSVADNLGEYTIENGDLKIKSVNKDLFGGFGRLDVTLQFPIQTDGSIIQYTCDMSMAGTTNYGKGWEKSADFQVRFIDEDEYAWEGLKWSPGTALPETYVSTKMNHSLETNCIQFQLFGKGDGNDTNFVWTINNLQIHSTNLPYYVSLDGGHTKPYKTWTTAATNIQAVMDFIEE